MERIASGGVASEEAELLPDRCAVASVVTDLDGEALAAVDLAVPAGTYTNEELISQFAAKVAATARHIAASLGAEGPSNVARARAASPTSQRRWA